MKQIKYICLIICLMSVSVFAAAPVGTATGQFLTIGVGGRAVAMGESITAATMGSESVFWNPAGLCEGSENDLFAAYNQWPGIHVGALSATYNSPTFGAFALHAKYVNFGDIEITTIDEPNGTGNMLLMSNYAIGLTYSRYLTDKVSMGATANFVHEKYGENGYNTIAYNVGLLYRSNFRNMKIGMSILNFAPEVQFSGSFIDFSYYDSYTTGDSLSFDTWSLPMTFRFGAVMDLYSEGPNLLIASFDMVHPNDNREQYNIGTEYAYDQKLFVRLGYRLTADAGGVSGGIGFKFEKIRFDYSLTSLGQLGLTNRLSLGLSM